MPHKTDMPQSHISVSAGRMKNIFCRGTVAQFDDVDLFDNMAAAVSTRLLETTKQDAEYDHTPDIPYSI